ncbi:MAG: Rne/Rng family ribonuclease, partial [Synergistaceae bacterium]|nr:Rne/Rng family ribonuclease [Synergistaceae bacterium]
MGPGLKPRAAPVANPLNWVCKIRGSGKDFIRLGEIYLIEDIKFDRKIIADTRENEETRVAIIERGRLAEIFIERMWDNQKAGEIYKARVESVVPGLNAAFATIGEGRNAFLYLNDARNLEIKPEMEIIVQVTKAARKNKGARVTPRISLPGRYVVLVPNGSETGVSRRIASEAERKRLRKFAKDLKAAECTEDFNFGLIIRTAAENVDEDALSADVKSLIKLWHEILNAAKLQNAPCLLYRDMGALGRVLRDEVHGDVDEIILDNHEEFERVNAFAESFYNNKPEITLYNGVTPIFEYFNIEREIAEALDRKVWLKSGAYLIIDQTEALTVIDVNTGKYIGGDDMRFTTLATNLEAADEIARQLRLRSIGGIIVVDFIDMELEEDRRTLISRLEKAFINDRSRARVFSVTQLGLVELTRKRGRPDLRSVLTRGCPFCSDNGWVLREDTMAMEIKRFIRKIIFTNKCEALLIQLNPTIADFIKSSYLRVWQDEFSTKIFIASAPDFAWEKY